MILATYRVIDSPISALTHALAHSLAVQRCVPCLPCVTIFLPWLHRFVCLGRCSSHESPGDNIPNPSLPPFILYFSLLLYIILKQFAYRPICFLDSLGFSLPFPFVLGIRVSLNSSVSLSCTQSCVVRVTFNSAGLVRGADSWRCFVLKLSWSLWCVMPMPSSLSFPAAPSSPSSSFTSMATTSAATTATAPVFTTGADVSHLSSSSMTPMPTLGATDENYRTRRPRPPHSLTRSLMRYLRSATRSNGGSRNNTASVNQQAQRPHVPPPSSSLPPLSSSSSSLPSPPLPLPLSSSSSSLSLSLLQQRGHSALNLAAENHLKPIYIYPGLLRIVRDKAIALDNQCPAVLYKCAECKRERDKQNAANVGNILSESNDYDDEFCQNRKHPHQSPHNNNRHCSATANTETASDCDSLLVLPSSASSSSSSTSAPCSPAVQSSQPPATSPPGLPFPIHDSRLRRCSHQISCAICLDEFHGKDLVRKLPCNVNHVFHSKCILDWFVSHQRCPLCNKPVARIPTKGPSCVVEPRTRSNAPEARRAPSDLVAESRRVRQLRGPRRASSASLTPPASMSSSQSQLSRTMPSVRVASPPSISSSRRNSLFPSDHQRRHQNHHHRSSSSSQHQSFFPRANARSSVGRAPSSREEPSSMRVAAHWRYSRHNRHSDHSEPADSSEMSSTSACGDNGRPARVTIVFPPSGDRTHRKSRGPRTYSYIVHDNVRMEMNPYIPV